jgi:RNA polymerase sigma-70 factor (ECF subfamily)
LLDRARAGDGCALELLCQRCLPRLEVWATGRLPRAVRGAVDTGDIVQETLLRVIRHVAVFLPRHEEAFQAYLRKTLFNLIKDAGRRARVLQALTSLVEEQVDPRPSPLDEAIGQDLAARYRAALERLPPDDQQVIILRVERGMSYAEVAAVTGKPSADAARMAVARARSRLAEELRDEVDASLAARAHGDGAARSGGNGHVRPPRRVRCIE